MKSWHAHDRKAGTKRNSVRSCAGTIAEFPIVLMVLLLFITFPLIDLLGLATGASTVVLMAHQTATRAAAQETYADALTCVQQEAETYLSTGFAKFAKLRAVGGIQQTGVNLYVVATTYGGNNVQTYGPNTPAPAPIDPTHYIYEFRTNATFEVGPVIPLASVPFIGDVPGLGKPATLRLDAHRVAEYNEAVEGLAAPPATSGGALASFDTTAGQTTGSANDANIDNTSGSGWNYPGIYQMIQASGQSIVAQNVLQVQASNNNWTDSGLQITNGEKVWFDSVSSGSWSFNGNSFFDANGNPGTSDPTVIAPQFTPGALIGKLGQNGSMFLMGDSLLNATEPGTGELYLIMNDWANNHLGDTGFQTVRIIVTK